MPFLSCSLVSIVDHHLVLRFLLLPAGVLPHSVRVALSLAFSFLPSPPLPLPLFSRLCRDEGSDQAEGREGSQGRCRASADVKGRVWTSEPRLRLCCRDPGADWELGRWQKSPLTERSEMAMKTLAHS